MSSDPERVTGRWSETEKRIFHVLFYRFGARAAAIAPHLNRSRQQVAHYAERNGYHFRGR